MVPGMGPGARGGYQSLSTGIGIEDFARETVRQNTLSEKKEVLVCAGVCVHKRYRQCDCWLAEKAYHTHRP